MIAWRSAGTRWYQPVRYSARSSFKYISRLLLGLCLSEENERSSRFQHLLYLRPRVGRQVLERRPVGVLHAIEDCGLHRRPLPHPPPPVTNRGVLLPHRAELEEFKAQDVGDHGTVGSREDIAGEVGAALEVVDHPRNHLLVLAKRVDHEF